MGLDRLLKRPPKPSNRIFCQLKLTEATLYEPDKGFLLYFDQTPNGAFVSFVPTFTLCQPFRISSRQLTAVVVVRGFESSTYASVCSTLVPGVSPVGTVASRWVCESFRTRPYLWQTIVRDVYKRIPGIVVDVVIPMLLLAFLHVFCFVGDERLGLNLSEEVLDPGVS
ncbi:hypothetical protein M0802_006157 [Mischocyttarus mexicanus]|nr:hypothetical protein M0802_006157 [Mischocyttarus mexicanus]